MSQRAKKYPFEFWVSNWAERKGWLWRTAGRKRGLISESSARMLRKPDHMSQNMTDQILLCSYGIRWGWVGIIWTNTGCVSTGTGSTSWERILLFWSVPSNLCVSSYHEVHIVEPFVPNPSQPTASSQVGLLSSLEQLLGELHLHCLASRGTIVPVMVIIGGSEDDLEDTIEDETRPKGLYYTFRRKYPRTSNDDNLNKELALMLFCMTGRPNWTNNCLADCRNCCHVGIPIRWPALISCINLIKHCHRHHLPWQTYAMFYGAYLGRSPHICTVYLCVTLKNQIINPCSNANSLITRLVCVPTTTKTILGHLPDLL